MMKFGRRSGFPGSGTFGRIPARRALAGVAEEIMEFLGDGKLHDLREVAKMIALSERDTEKILNFLMQGSLIEKGVRITKSGHDFLKLPI
jgi:hypothetical protein